MQGLICKFCFVCVLFMLNSCIENQSYFEFDDLDEGSTSKYDTYHIRGSYDGMVIDTNHQILGEDIDLLYSSSDSSIDESIGEDLPVIDDFEAFIGRFSIIICEHLEQCCADLESYESMYFPRFTNNEECISFYSNSYQRETWYDPEKTEMNRGQAMECLYDLENLLVNNCPSLSNRRNHIYYLYHSLLLLSGLSPVESCHTVFKGKLELGDSCHGFFLPYRNDGITQRCKDSMCINEQCKQLVQDGGHCDPSSYLVCHFNSHCSTDQICRLKNILSVSDFGCDTGSNRCDENLFCHENRCRRISRVGEDCIYNHCEENSMCIDNICVSQNINESCNCSCDNVCPSNSHCHDQICTEINHCGQFI